jgi:hypothetical protein
VRLAQDFCKKDNIQVGYIVRAQEADLERRIKGFSEERRLTGLKQTKWRRVYVHKKPFNEEKQFF